MNAPETFGDYELIDCFARGGMGELFRARQRGIDDFERLLCVKRISAEHVGKWPFEEMFVSEARITAQLCHPNVPQIHAYGRVSGVPFMAMELVNGPDLGATMMSARDRKAEIPLSFALGVASGLAAALSHAHGRRGSDGAPMELVHRDVSPHNVVLSYEGAVKLVDFGLARAQLGGRLLTPPGRFDGNEAYRAPEQLVDPMVDHRADVFSLGTLLYELVAGEPCFRGDTPEEIAEQVTTHQPDLGALASRRGLPDAFVRVLDRSLRKSPADRYASAAAMEIDLEAAAEACSFVGPGPIARFLETLARQNELPGSRAKA